MKRRQILRTALIGTSALLLGAPALSDEPEVYEDNGVRITPGYGRDYVCIDRGTPGYATVGVITETDPTGGGCWRMSFETRIDRMVLDTIRELSEEGYVLDSDYPPQVFWNGCSDLVWDLPATITLWGRPVKQGAIQGRMDPAWLKGPYPGLGAVREAEGIISLARTKGIRNKDLQDDLDCIGLKFRMKADLDTRKGRDMFRACLAAKAQQS